MFRYQGPGGIQLKNQKTDVGGQKAENGERKAENGEQ